MKRVVLSAFFLTALMTVSTLVANDAAAVQGGWSRKDYRSSNPAAQAAAIETLPSVSIENGIVLMSFATDLSDLKVSVATPKGTIVYETIVSANGGLTIPIRTGLQSGTYVLLLSHPRIGVMMDRVNVQ